MSRISRLLPILVFVAVGIVGVQAPALAASPAPSSTPDAGASAVASSFASVKPDTGALAINTTPGSSIFALAFDIKFLTSSTIAPVNLALAYASCTACQTVAISIQVVIYQNGAPTVAPQNGALAINVLCTLCDTLAAAYQFVIGTSGPVRLTEDGRDAIREIREALLELQRTPGLTTAQIDARVKALMSQLATVLATQLVPIKAEPGEGPNAHNETVTLISPSPTSRPYTVPSPSPSATPSPSPSPSASAVTISPSPTR
ncbi:MAG: hypothetical protein NVS3B24_15610 [Candidatus Dormibacteria bacterium]